MAVATLTASVHKPNAKEEKVLQTKLAPLYAEKSKNRVPALRYGRKLLRYSAGRRTTPPPLGQLPKREAAKVAEALGVQLKAEKTTKTRKH